MEAAAGVSAREVHEQLAQDEAQAAHAPPQTSQTDQKDQ
jgi:hypothetical protein